MKYCGMGLAAAVLLLLGTVGCSVFSMAEPQPLPLQGTLWKPKTIAGAEQLTLTPEADVRLVIQPGNRVNGAAGDNFFFGECQLKNNSLKFNPLGVTRRAGPNQEYEQKFLEALNRCEKYRIEGGELLLFDAAGKTLAVFSGSIPKAEK